MPHRFAAPLRLTFPRICRVDFSPSTTLSFVNLSSLYQVLDLPPAQRETCVYFCDGWLLILLLRLLSGGRIPALPRVSFDFTSLAPAVFTACQRQGQPLYLVGATAAEMAAFRAKIIAHYPGLRLVGARAGYFAPGEETATARDIVASAATVLLVGMGGGRQEAFIAHARAQGFTGLALSCGGFIRQTAGGADLHYYPAWINRLNLRFAYRMWREPHTVRRYLLDYPRNALRLARDLLARRLVIDVVGLPPAAPPGGAPAPDAGPA